MPRLNAPIVFATALGEYTADELVGEGGTGRVYGATSDDGRRVAVKLLDTKRATTKQRRRFQNEIAFLSGNLHPNLVTVLDHGLTGASPHGASAPFYVMPRFDGHLGDLVKTLKGPDEILGVFAQVLDGVEAAHMKGAWHRDLKPQNLLVEMHSRRVCVADFGIAHFCADDLAARVETTEGERLANFNYAAPEQKQRGAQVDQRADIFALGLILNEMFTGTVPHGTSFRRVGDVAPTHAFLDSIVDRMLANDPGVRPADIRAVKSEIQAQATIAVAMQRVSEVSRQVVPESTIDDRLAEDVVSVTDAGWREGVLSIQLSHAVNEAWHRALRKSARTAVLGIGAERFEFRGAVGTVNCQGSQAQQVIDYFKQWLPGARDIYRQRLENDARTHEEALRRELAEKRRQAEEQLRVNRDLKF